MAERVQLTLHPRTGVKPLDEDTAARIGRVAHAETVELDNGDLVLGFSPPEGDASIVRGNVELAARFELGAHWQTRYELAGP